MKERPRASLIAGLSAWGLFALMVIAPFFDQVGEYEWAIITPRGQWAIALTPFVIFLGWIGFELAGTKARRALFSFMPIVATVLYWVVPWIWIGR